jgi:hypothetical protein
VSFWGFLPVGWLAWLAVTVRDRRADRRRALDADPTGSSLAGTPRPLAPSGAVMSSGSSVAGHE